MRPKEEEFHYTSSLFASVPCMDVKNLHLKDEDTVPSCEREISERCHDISVGLLGAHMLTHTCTPVRSLSYLIFG